MRNIVSVISSCIMCLWCYEMYVYICNELGGGGGVKGQDHTK